MSKNAEPVEEPKYTNEGEEDEESDEYEDVEVRTHPFHPNLLRPRSASRASADAGKRDQGMTICDVEQDDDEGSGEEAEDADADADADAGEEGAEGEEVRIQPI